MNFITCAQNVCAKICKKFSRLRFNAMSVRSGWNAVRSFRFLEPGEHINMISSCIISASKTVLVHVCVVEAKCLHAGGVRRQIFTRVHLRDSINSREHCTCDEMLWNKTQVQTQTVYTTCNSFNIMNE